MTLFEHFNTSNQTSPRFERHENFIIELQPPGCALAQTFNYMERCSFVMKTEDCRENVKIFDYTDIYYCILAPDNGLAEFGAILLVLFIGYIAMSFVQTIAEEFFCPPLQVITLKMGISENLAGITLLAFGNSAPDLVGSLSRSSERVGTVYSDNLGSAMFITTFISGIIIAMKPFQVEATSFVRDIAFYILAITYINLAIKSNKGVTMEEGIVMLCLYPAYFIIIMVDHYFLMQTLKSLTNKSSEGTLSDGRFVDYFVDQTANDYMYSFKSADEEERLKQLEYEAGIDKITNLKIKASAELDKKANTQAKGANARLFWQFLGTINPMDMDKWHSAGLCKRIYMLTRCPIDFVLFALIPVVNYEKSNEGWSKLLNCIQVPLMPAVLSIIKAPETLILGYHVSMFSLFVTVPLGIFIFLLTRTDTPPRFHFVFAVATMFCSISLIQVCTKELINIIELFGLVTYRSLSFLGCTIASFGDSIGDLIASIELAKSGYQRMGLAACIAGPLFYLTLGLGSFFIYKGYLNNVYNYPATQGSMGENCTIFLMVSLVAMLFSGLATNFRMRRSIGFFLVITFILFCIYCVLGEFEVIHPFGTDHSEDYGVQFM